MSNPLAIAAVTATLRNVLIEGFRSDAEVGDTSFTTKPLDKARTGTTNQLNLFLYQTLPNAAWGNHDMPPTRNGEQGWPPLSLDLHYLLTSFGRNDDDVWGHHVLGRAMGVLADHPVLDPQEIKNALSGADLDLQPERVRITPLPLTVDDLSKLWNAFQTQYRVSTAYRVSVVLIQSSRPTRSPLPVLTRNPNAQASLIPPYPGLTSLSPPSGNPAAVLGDLLTVRGHHLAGDTVSVQISGPGLAAPADLAPEPGAGDAQLGVRLPSDAYAQATWRAGAYSVAVAVTTGGETRVTNALPVMLAPKIDAIRPDPAVRDAGGRVWLTVTCSPRIGPEQRAELLLGGRDVIAQPHTAVTGTLVFAVANAPAGRIAVRLRVDGVDSLLIDRTTDPPTFLDSQAVTIR